MGKTLYCVVFASANKISNDQGLLLVEWKAIVIRPLLLARSIHYVWS